MDSYDYHLIADLTAVYRDALADERAAERRALEQSKG